MFTRITVQENRTQLADMAEIVIVISAADIEKNKVRGDLGITYDVDVVRLIGEFEKKGLYVGSVVITQFAGQSGAVQFREKLEKRGIKVYHRYTSGLSIPVLSY